MRRFVMNHFSHALLMFLMVMLAVPAFGQTINVTVQLNTATNRDTLMEHHYVDLRGESTGEVVPNVTWDANTGVVLQNVGGDYWHGTFQMTSGDTLRYKFWTGFDNSTGTFFWDGWEGPLTGADGFDGGGNRTFIAGNQDTTLTLQFYNGNEAALAQYWRPYEAKPDSFAVYYRVNLAALMETQEFVPGTDEPVSVYGGYPIIPSTDPSAPWDVPVVLTQEEGSVDNGSFYSGTAYIANTAIAAGDGQAFKFTYRNGVAWESINNRVFTYSGAKDTTIHWSYWNNQPPTGGNIVTATLTFQMKTDGLEKLGLFDRSLGETIVVDGAKAWDIDNPIIMNYDPLLQSWIAQEPFTRAPGATLEYKAVLFWDDSRVDSLSANFIPGLDLEVPLQFWEEPSVTGAGNRNYTYTSNTQQFIPGDFGFDFQYFSGLPAEGVIETAMSVTYNIDMTPATDVNTNPSNPLFRPGIDSVWVQYYGSLMALSQGDGLYDNTPLLLEDPDGDLIYSGTFELTPPFPFDVGYRVNYSTETGAIIQNGGGFARGRNYYQFIQPVSVNLDGSITWPAEYSFPTLQWMDSDLTAEDPPNLWVPTSVNDRSEAAAIETFELAQNYPNPFNPETTISYQVPRVSEVKIDVYNVMGQHIATLVDVKRENGRYSVQWDGRDHRGLQTPSGI